MYKTRRGILVRNHDGIVNFIEYHNMRIMPLSKRLLVGEIVKMKGRAFVNLKLSSSACVCVCSFNLLSIKVRSGQLHRRSVISRNLQRNTIKGLERCSAFEREFVLLFARELLWWNGVATPNSHVNHLIHGIDYF